MGRGSSFVYQSEGNGPPDNWNDTDVGYPNIKCIHQLVETQARKTPDAIALVYGKQQLTYEELNRRSSCLARYLQLQGIQPDQPVGLCVERSLEMVVGILGILRAGGAYLPLEPQYPGERLQYMLQDSRVEWVLTQSRFTASLSPLLDDSVHLLSLDREWESITEGAQRQPALKRQVRLHHLAYILYTSGSTGRPKGVMLEHRALCNRILWMEDEYGLSPEDRVLQKTPFSFDVSGWEFFWPLITGARLVLAAPEKHKDPYYLRDTICRSGITVLHFVPSMFHSFLGIAEVERCNSIRKVFCSGEALTVQHTTRFFETFGDRELHNLYGPTEAAIDVSYYACRKEASVVPIGKPIANIRLYILDSRMNPSPIGSEGELCIAGIGLARGYLNRPDLTADRFFPDPFASTPGAHLYRTGDLARWLPDGNIEYLGRIDNQIKLRGNRIEPGEIEVAFREHEAVSECAVVVQQDERGERRLVAWFSPDARHARAILKHMEMEAQGLLADRKRHTLPNGMEIIHLNPGETDFLYQEIFEDNGYLKHGLAVLPGDCVFDVGANIGLFSLCMAREQVQVHAFEPMPEVYEVMRLNTRMYSDTIRTYPCGLSDAPGQETFTYYPNVTILSGAHADLEEEIGVVRSYLSGENDGHEHQVNDAEVDELLRARLETREVRCQLRTISEIIAEQGIKTIDLLKIDVEKMEHKVIEGIAAKDWPKIRQMVIEVHDIENRAQQMQALLAAKGFTVVVEQDDALRNTPIYSLYARRTSVRTDQPHVNTDRQWYNRAGLVRDIELHLASRLPEYMQPSAIIPLVEIPLTTSGKLDRGQLTTREIERTRTKQISLPQSEVEEQMLEIWEDLLGIMDISLEDGFLEAGGNSLLAISLIERINKTFGCSLTTTTLFKYPSIKELSAHIAATTTPTVAVAAAPTVLPAVATATPETPVSQAFSDIEAALAEHPSVAQSVVFARENKGQQTLVAYVRPNWTYFRQKKADQDAAELLKNWIPIWEQNYEPILDGEESSEETLNSIGYVTSDSGDQIPEAEVRECVDLAVGQVMDHRPTKMLEIGCGSGMLLFQLAGRVEHYYATDLSENAIEHIHASLVSKPYRDRVTCFRCDASDLKDVPVEEVDTVMIHSVIQYFPGIDYLTNLIRTLAERLPARARIFIGDVRDLRLLKAFHAAVLAHQCPPETSRERFAQMLSDRVRLEKELVIDPLYFKNLTRTLPRIKQVRIAPKKGQYHNEFIKYRFDTLLYLDEPCKEGALPQITPWPEQSPGDMLDWVTANPQSRLLTGVPNRRVWREQAILDWMNRPEGELSLGAALARIDATPDHDKGVDPFTVLSTCNTEAVAATIHWEHPHEDGRFEIYLQPASKGVGELPHRLAYKQDEPMELDGANFPGFSVVWQDNLPLLKRHLDERLAKGRIPARFIFQTSLPTTADGQVDRAAVTGEQPAPPTVPTAIAGTEPMLAAAPVAHRAAKTVLPAYYADSFAIIGISCHVPGAQDHHYFWQNLLNGHESVALLSAEELAAAGIAEELRQNPNYVPARLTIEDKDCFDPAFFNISPRNAAYMDPQARLLLLHSWKAMEDAGLAVGDTPETGVFMSATTNFYQLPLGLPVHALQGADGHAAGIQAQGGMIPNTISYHLGLKGPSMFVQSLCSSSLVGLKLACQSLQAGEAKMALIGGANLFAFSRVGHLYEPEMNLSDDGHCRTFDAAATGVVEGEGVCVIVLKKALDAVADRDHIYALLRGISLNNDGADKAGFHAPGVKGQAAAARAVLTATGVDPTTIRYVEAHGTGTPSGDAIEVAALSEAYPNGTHRCAIGSLKPNIGNLDTAGGLAGVIKVALGLYHGAIPPQINFNEPAPDIDFTDSPFYVPTQAEPWQDDKAPRRAAQNHYSLGGTNVHAIYEAVAPASPSPAAAGPFIVPLSARDDNRLHEMVQNLIAFLQGEPATDLSELAYTLQVGRVAMKQRVAFLVRDNEALSALMHDFLAGRENSACLRGTAERREQRLFENDEDAKELMQGWLRKGRLEKLAELWVKGVRVDWRCLHATPYPRRISMPTYPFARERYWIPETAPDAPAPMALRTTPQPVAVPVAELASRTHGSLLSDQVAVVLKGIISDLLMVGIDDLDPISPFNEFGFDSVSLISFANRLNQEYDLDLKPMVLFENPTIQSFTTYLVETYGDILAARLQAPAPGSKDMDSRADSQPPQGLVVPPSPSPVMASTPAVRAVAMPQPSESARHDAPIAIIGMSGSFPAAPDLDTFWENLRDGRDCISEIPPDRWDWRAIEGDPSEDGNKTKVRWGGFIDGVAEFDPLFFGISPREAESMDPQNRLLMTHVWLAMEDAGHSAQSLSGSDTGIFVGTGDTGYASLMGRAAGTENYAFLGIFPFGGPNRMSFFLNLHGPSEPINTGCSSSLVAIHKAVTAIRDGSCRMAFAGGVNTVPTPDGHISFSRAGMLCEDGRCKAFAANANGFVRGEGVGILVLKPLADAEQDGDHIYAVIRGSAQNHGGRSNSFTAPNPKAQAALLTEAYTRTGVDPAHVGYIETHGTGTHLGDPIEIEGLKTAFRQLNGSQTENKGHCGLGAVKSNIGHSEMAAGIAGLIKVVLQLKNKTLAKNLHCQEINPYIQIEDSPFYIVQETRDWSPIRDAQGRALPRLAGVSSFGIGGVNAHVIVEEYIPPVAAATPASPEPALIVLSAKNGERLREMAANLHRFVAHQAVQSDVEPAQLLANLAYTLQVGREPLEERLAFTVTSLDMLRDKLAAFLNKGSNGTTDTTFFHGRIKQFREALTIFMSDDDMQTAVDAWVAKKKYAQLLQLWVRGMHFDWNRLYTTEWPRRMSLPTYPFARERYWVETEPAAQPASTFPASPSSARPETQARRLLTPGLAEDASSGESSGQSRQYIENRWTPVPLAGDIDWQARLKQQEGTAITVIYSEEKRKDELFALLRNLEGAANLARPLMLDAVHVQDLARALGRADVVLFLGPGPELPPQPPSTVATHVDALVEHLREPAWDRPVHIYCLYEGDATRPRPDCEALAGVMNAAIAKNPRHAWTLIGHCDPESDTTGYQRLLGEWLAEPIANAPAKPTRTREIRYEASQRLVRQTATVAKTENVLAKVWEQKNLPTGDARPLAGKILVIVNPESIHLGQTLFAATNEVVLAGDGLSDRITYHFDPNDVNSGRSAAQRILSEVGELTLILDLSDLYTTPRERAESSLGKVSFYQILVGAFSPYQLVYVTLGLQHFRAERMSLAGAKFAGLVKMMSAEYRHLSARCIDIDRALCNDPRAFEAVILGECHMPLEETEICYRHGDRFVPTLEVGEPARYDRDEVNRRFSITADGVYVISGGTSGIGLEIARYLVSRGARRLVLMGITPLPPRDQWVSTIREGENARLAALNALAAELERLDIYTGTLSNAAALANFFNRIRRESGPIKGVVHSAGVYSDIKNSAFVTRDIEDMRQILEPKVNGMEHLAECFADDPLDFFVSFSSLTSFIPLLARGISDYAMANAFLDFFSAWQHHHQRTHYRAITWVDWNETGVAQRMTPEEFALVEKNLERVGLSSFSNEEGRHFFEQAMLLPNQHHVLPCFIDAARLNAARAELLHGISRNLAESVPETPHPVVKAAPMGAALPAVSNMDRRDDLVSPDWQLKARVTQWEQQGEALSFETLTRYVSFDQLKQQDPTLIQRVYQLLYPDEPAAIGNDSVSPKPSESDGEPISEIVYRALLDVLKIDGIDEHESFANYGLDSISAMVFSTRLEKRLDMEIPPHWLIDFPTIQTLSEQIQQNQVLA